MMKRVIALSLSILMVLVCFTVTLAEETTGTTADYRGTMEISGVTLSYQPDYFLGSNILSGRPSLGSIIKLRNDLKLALNDQTSVQLRIGYTDNTPQELTTNGDFDLNRAFIDFTPNDLISVRLGKQRLAWGNGYAWNPTDILDESRDAFTDIDDPQGVMAFRSDLHLGSVTAQAIVTPKDSWEDSGRALRFKISPAGLDLTLGLAQKGSNSTATLADFAYSLSGVGIHGEALYQAEGNEFRDDKQDILNYLVGADYNFPGGFYMAFEYYHNDEAFQDAKEFQNYCFQRFAQSGAAVLGELQTTMSELANNGGITRDHLFVRATKGFGENINTELLLVINSVDGSLIGQPKLEYDWNQNTALFVKGMLVNGGRDSEAQLIPTNAQWNLGLRVIF